jgi:2-iminoacetate synthase
MEEFRLDVEAVAAGRARAAEQAERAAVSELVQRAWRNEPLGDEALAALFLARAVPTEELLAIAAASRRAHAARLETFSPLYITNECDAECRMCGMRRDNAGLVRETADSATVAAQLDLLYRRGLRGVAVLTGEYHRGARRATMIARAAEAVRLALARGFTHVLVNIGALDAAEYGTLLADLPRRPDGRVVPQLTMCTFQETYDPAVYARFMGTTAANPRSDFVRRLTNFDRAADAGMWAANPGVLLGLNPDLGFELLALLAHLRHLAGRGMRLYASLPRLRRASGAAATRSPSDDALARLAAVLAFGVPEAQVVISTREPPAVQRRLLPVIGVLTPGSPGVAPYTETGARFDLEASQFEVHDHRPIETILGEILARGIPIDGYEPAHA